MSDQSANTPLPSSTGTARGEVFDLGYHRYTGRREGRGWVIRALAIYSLKRALGIKKRWTAKIVPIVLYAFAFIPVIAIVGIRSFAGGAIDIGYNTLYSALSLTLLVFAATAGPEMLCDDRRYGVLPLYFSRALTRTDYLAAKVGALALLMASIALLPPFILFLGNTFLDASPIDYLTSHLGDLGRVLVLGALLAVLYAAVSLVVAAFTDRKGIATAVNLGLVLISTGIIGAVFAALEGSWRRYLVLLSPSDIADGLIGWVFGFPSGPSTSLVAQAGISGWWYLLAVAVIAVTCGIVMHRRYLRDA